MEEIFDQNFRCRLCLNFSNRLESLFAPDSKYKCIVEDFTGLEIEQKSELPSTICERCIDIINTLLEFRLTCKKSQEILENQHKSIKVETLHGIEESSDYMLPIINFKVENEDYCEFDQEISDDDRIINDPLAIEDESKKDKAKLTISKNAYIKLVQINEMKEIQNTRSQKNEVKNEELKMCQKQYECKIDGCDKSFSFLKELRLHKERSHKAYLPHECEICEHRFRDQKALRSHRATHFDPEIPCTICGKLYVTTKSMRRHMLTHSGVRPFKCERCSKCFINRWALKEHMRIHTRTETKQTPSDYITCDLCGKLLLKKSLIKHMYGHADERPHKCVDCPKSFITRWKLKVHCLKVHGKYLNQQNN